MSVPNPVQTPFPQQPVTSQYNALAIASLVCGILGFFTGLSAIAAVICGHLSLTQISRTHEDGRGMAMAGLITGYVVIGMTMLLGAGLLIVVAMMAGMWGSSSSFDSLWSTLGTLA
ncbi:MAG: DUF4190 domain-containing protein [Microbacteriaceae bacterium]|jgi:peptidyl-prolyl cis-trans isomerase B (cyclophilin B)|nr:DUF4190 domain-containing protein [Microbacteriaceae bacterium]MCI1207040.1 DUF4190 domain-containing protein [Microbacteriaceae bacterium]